MAKLIVVVGATGGQGGGVVNEFLQSPEYRVRGITRNPSSEKAKALVAKGVEVVAADLNDEKSLEKAFEGAYAIFGVTDYYDYFFTKGKDASMELEFTQGTNMAKAASRVPTLKRYVCSTLPHTSKITEGKAIVPHFEGKGRASTFIKENLPELYAKTTFTIFTIFAVNMHHYPIFRPVYLASAQKWVQFYPTSPDSPYPCVGDHATNSGIFVRAIVERPPAEAGTYVRCNVEDLTLESYLALWGKASGISPAPNSTKVVQISVADYVSLWGHMGEEQSSQWVFFEHLAKMRQQGLIGDDLPGATMVEGVSLLSEDEKKGLKSVEASLGELDWSSIIVRSSL
ncbi:Uncharacterized protein BP5553_00486 [Venustampulla echinocandica]|uniref:NmrA-like domain-containing protein n=1 Tax=Venustampulla echinocandica TaxID=2656787 RepID=A0A370TYA4_9HELO|nr:Uncharacterized protein BP5553_00486 [Venustampulla echinocandica]RDL40507.1 Uncharacterized protein BP5553_00486 [Venustampulla echinocandica]